MLCRFSLKKTHSMSYFKTTEELINWINQDIWNGLTYIIASNPRGAYEVVLRTFPDFPLWGAGVEQSENSKQVLFDFVKRKAMLSGAPEMNVFQFGMAVPQISGSEFTFLEQKPTQWQV